MASWKIRDESEGEADGGREGGREKPMEGGRRETLMEEGGREEGGGRSRWREEGGATVGTMEKKRNITNEQRGNGLIMKNE